MPRTERGLDRLVAFTDAVVPIAITLVVLPLVDAATSGAIAPATRFARTASGSATAKRFADTGARDGWANAVVGSTPACSQLRSWRSLSAR
jgi:hypothetical protein